MAEGKPNGGGYSWQTGFVYVFNLIVGAALLALPKAFAETGWVLGLIFLNILAVFSYATVTYVIETMSIANAVIRHNAKEAENLKTNNEKQVKYDNPVFEKDENVVAAPTTPTDDSTTEDSKNVVPATDDTNEKIASETDNSTKKVGFTGNKIEPTTKYKSNIQKELEAQKNDEDMYAITVKVELGEMAALFFNKAGVILYYVSLCLYLYGGMSVYAAAISKSLTTVVCSDTKCFEGNVTASCGEYTNISVVNMYRLSLAGVVLFICPFVFFNISNTKILQMFTTTYRWVSMFIMIALAFLRLARETDRPSVKTADFNELPNFFGVAVYSFMCQHSIPAVVTPVTNKSRVKLFVLFDFVFIIILYSTVVLSATFAFGEDELLDLYSLNFNFPIVCKYILQLYPVFTLTANFPILGIVLRENIGKLFLPNTNEKHNGFFIRRILFPLIAVVPPICVACMTYDVSLLVGYSGTYAGALLQYVIPALLVYCARRHATNILGEYRNRFTSPFRHTGWVYVVLVWYLVCLVFVTYNKIAK